MVRIQASFFTIGCHAEIKVHTGVLSVIIGMATRIGDHYLGKVRGKSASLIRELRLS